MIGLRSHNFLEYYDFTSRNIPGNYERSRKLGLQETRMEMHAESPKYYERGEDSILN